MEDYTYDHVNGTNIYLYQHKKIFHINIDTALLAQFMKVKKGGRILDIGMSNGALLLAAYRYIPSYLYGIDIQPEAIVVMEKNMEHHHITNAVLMTQGIYDVALEKIDIVACSPPYFKADQGSNLNESQSLRMARHERFLTLRTLCQRVSELLDEKRRFYMMHRAFRVSGIAYTLKRHRLEIRTLQFIYDADRKETVNVSVEAVRDGRVNARVSLPQIVER